MSAIEPHRSIIPIVRLLERDSGDSVREVLGTGFFVAGTDRLVTARHVLRTVLSDRENLGICYLKPDKTIEQHRITQCDMSEKFDVASFRAAPLPGIIGLSIIDGRVSEIHDVLTYEFSPTSIEEESNGKRLVHFNPYTHKGNVVNHFISTFPEAHPTSAFLTSFPALQGASGAPVLRLNDLAVAGMLVANFERHLIPAQTVRLEEANGTAEETSYFLPLGKAIASEVIIDHLRAVGTDPQLVQP